MLIVKAPWARWFVAAALLIGTTLVNMPVQELLLGRAPLLPFFPALIVIGFLCGAGPGAASVSCSVLLVAWFWVEPEGLQAIRHPTDVSMLVLFALAGGLCTGTAVYARHLVEEGAAMRQRLSMALTAGRMVAWEWDIETQRVEFSEGAAAIFGTTWSAADDAWPLGHPEDIERVRGTIEAAIAGGTSYNFVSRMYRKDDGRLRWIETHGFVHRERDGRPWKVTGVTQDVSDRQEALDASRVAQRRAEVALTCSKVIAWETDQDLRCTWMHNPGSGRRPEAFIGKRLGEVQPRERFPEYAEAIERVLRTGVAEQLPVSYHRTGGVRHYISNIEPILDAAGAVAGLVGASLDVTDLRRAQDELRVESERKDLFLATLAHELRNPLAPIRYAVASLGDHAPPAARERARQVIERQTAQMAHLLDDLLDLSRISRNVIELRTEPVDLRAAAEQALDNVHPLMEQRQHRIVLSLPPSPLMVSGDPVRLQQVIGNLLDNAAKYTPRGGQVELRLDTDDGGAVLSVKDNGAGMDPAQVERSFELFAQLHKATEHDQGGLGIGLAVVRQIVEMHGGRITATSDGLGRGSTFSVSLPLVIPSAAAHETQGTAAVVTRWPGSAPLLLVDDNRDAVDTLADILRAHGLDVAVTYSGPAALAALDAVKPAGVLMDIGMPGMSGHELARAIRSRPGGEHLLLIAITGWGQAQDLERSRAAGFDHHLVKPVDPATVLATLAERLPRADARLVN